MVLFSRKIVFLTILAKNLYCRYLYVFGILIKNFILVKSLQAFLDFADDTKTFKNAWSYFANETQLAHQTEKN